MSSIDNGKVAFFDTHALHFVYLYLKRAKESHMYPFSECKEARDEAESWLCKLKEPKLRDSLRKGLRGVVWLLVNEVEVKYSPASELELITGRARGKAIENAAQEGLIPDRMWTRVDDGAIKRRLVSSELGTIKSDIDSLAQVMEQAGISTTALEQSKNIEMMELARGIGGVVYLGSIDMMIFASALVAQADFLITEDGFLRRTVNSVRTGNAAIREQFLLLVSTVSLVDAALVVLPKAIRIPRDIVADGR